MCSFLLYGKVIQLYLSTFICRYIAECIYIYIHIHTCIYIFYIFSIMVYLNIEYSSLLFIHYICNSLHPLTSSSQSFPPPPYPPWQPQLCSLCPRVCFCLINRFICDFFFFFLGLHLWHMEVPRLGWNWSYSCWPMPQPQQHTRSEPHLWPTP